MFTRERSHRLQARLRTLLEGMLAHGLTADTPGTSLVENGAFLKGVLHEGSLQEKPGPSIATEFGVLLPGVHNERGTGASLAGIVSQRLIPKIGGEGRIPAVEILVGTR